METVELSRKKFIFTSLAVSLLILLMSFFYTPPRIFLAFEVAMTILGLFVLGSAKYRLDKNALTYGSGFVIVSTFWSIWWPTSTLKHAFHEQGFSAILSFLGRHFLTLHGLNDLFHADTMFFILGLTFFVSVIAQTRLLETVTFLVLKKTGGQVLSTIAVMAAVVSVASGILDGVSMIGLMIRILVMILFLARVEQKEIVFMVMVSTIITTVCGMWLAYGEPPNLIMKSNLHPYLNDSFFIRYCLPVAVGSFLIIYWNLRKRFKGKQVKIDDLDILDVHMADVKFLQAMRHGEVLLPTEFVDFYKEELGGRYEKIEQRLHQGEPLGLALIREEVPREIRLKLLGLFLAENIAEELDNHYQNIGSDSKIREIFHSMRQKRVRAQWMGGLAFVPFVGFLAWHAMNHSVPLFLASFSGFLIAFLGIFNIANVRKLALHEGFHEYKEYLFLLPLFFSITLLQKTGFFDQMSNLLHQGIEKWGPAHVAYAQFAGATFLSAILDNNVVADFASRALHGLGEAVLHLFAMAQIAGYAAGGCWTHIGSAQSVVAYSFIRREIDEQYTPIQWIKAMTPIILEVFILMTLVVYGEAYLSSL